jgi:hypothetical protein
MEPDMSKLTAAKRNALPAADFAQPGKRAYPVNDKGHAANAKARASQAVNAGRMSVSIAKKIDAKADRVLGESPKLMNGGMVPAPAKRAPGPMPMSAQHEPLPMRTRHGGRGFKNGGKC